MSQCIGKTAMGFVSRHHGLMTNALKLHTAVFVNLLSRPHNEVMPTLRKVIEVNRGNETVVLLQNFHNLQC